MAASVIETESLAHKVAGVLTIKSETGKLPFTYKGVLTVSRQPAFNYPDHLGQIAFAYGIVNKIFIPEQVAMIRFDHGDTPESFVQEYWNPEWLAVLLQKIDTAMPAEEDASLKIPLTSGTHLDDPHPCCDCGS